MAVAAFVISVLALAASAVALVYSRRQAVAAERSAQADERAVALAEAEAARYTPPWVWHWEKGDTYLLVNESDEAAYNVVIDFADLLVPRGESQHERIGPRSAVSVLVIRHAGSTNDVATVTWSRSPDGPRLDWSHPFPHKPK